MPANKQIDNDLSRKNNSISSTIEENTKNYDVKNQVKKSTKKATFMLSQDLHKRLKTAAVEQDMTMLEIVEEALENHLKK